MLLIIILKWNHLISKVILSKIGTLNKIKMKTIKLTLLNSRLDKKWLWVKNKESRLKCLKANWKEKWLKMDLLGFLKLKTRAPTWVILTFILNCKIWEKNKIKMKKLIFKINHSLPSYRHKFINKMKELSYSKNKIKNCNYKIKNCNKI